MNLRGRIEDGFGVWADWMWRARWWVIAGLLAATAALGTRVPLLQTDTSAENFLSPDDPIKLAYDELRDRFGRDQLVILAIEPSEIFDLDFLEKLSRFHEDLEAEVPYLDEVLSLKNARAVRGQGDVLLVDDLLEDLPRDAAELAALRERVRTTPSYLDALISSDLRVTAVIVRTLAYSPSGGDGELLEGFEPEASTEPESRVFLTGEENAQVIRAVQAVVDRYQGTDFPVRMAGSAVLPHELSTAMLREVPRFFGAAVLSIAVLLSLLLRRVVPMLMALAVVVLSVIATLGVAQILGYRITLSTQILPSFLLSVGVGYSVHLLVMFLQELDRCGDRREALEQALRHSGLPIVMTGLTTVGGMASFLSASLQPIKELGVTGSAGVALTLAYTLLLLPALLAVVPMRARPGSRAIDMENRVLQAISRLSARHPWPVAISTLSLAVVGLVVAFQAKFSNDPLAYLPPSNPFRQSMYYVDERMGGALTLEVLVDTGRENGLHDPELLDRMDAMRARVDEMRAQGEKVRKTTSLLDIAKETHQALNENRPEFYAIPRDRTLLAQELLLFENSGSDDLEQLVDSQFSLARFSVRTLWEDGLEKADFVDRATREFSEIIGERAELTISGMAAVITHTVRATTHTLASSYLLALLTITPMMMMLGNVRAGLVSMVPNLVPIILTLALMVPTGIPLDMFTLMTGNIAIGLAVDDTIHFIATFRRYLAQTGDPVKSVDLTMATTGRALLFTAIVLTIGFLIFTLSSMANLRAFGVLTGFAIAIAVLFEFTATPALLVLVSRGGRRTREES
jgi:predicted RND superfamily exporter protein